MGFKNLLTGGTYDFPLKNNAGRIVNLNPGDWILFNTGNLVYISEQNGTPRLACVLGPDAGKNLEFNMREFPNFGLKDGMRIRLSEVVSLLSKQVPPGPPAPPLAENLPGTVA